MNWISFIRDLLLVVVGGIVSIITTVVLRQQVDSHKQKQVSKIILGDITSHLVRLTAMSRIIHRLGDSTMDEVIFEKSFSRYNILSYNQVIYNSIVSDLHRLPEEVFNKVSLFYSVLNLYYEEIRDVVVTKDKKLIESVFDDCATQLVKSGDEAATAIMGKVIKDRKRVEDFKCMMQENEDLLSRRREQNSRNFENRKR